MTEPLRLWLETAHHAAFQVGGWAWVLGSGPVITGMAGGDRRLDADRTTLLALAAALKGLPPGRPVRLHTASRLLAALPARIAAAQAGEDPPATNLDLWAGAMTALSGGVRIETAEPYKGSPTAFAAGWADLARDKAKAGGAFAFAIPKPNLAKAGVS